MLSTVRRNYLIHGNPVVQTAINTEIIKTNRNNGLWKNYMGSTVRKAAGDVIEGCKPAIPVPNNVSPSILPCGTNNNNNFSDSKSRLKRLIMEFRKAYENRTLTTKVLQQFIDKLSKIGYSYNYDTYPTLINTDNFNSDIQDSPKNLAEALLWKLGKWKTYKNFVNYYKDDQSKPSNTDIVFFAFAKYLKDKRNPILDQQTIRAMWGLNLEINDKIKNLCKEYLLKKDGEWKQSGSGQSGEKCYEYYKDYLRNFKTLRLDLDKLDKFFMPLGRALKEKTKDYNEFYNLCFRD